MPPAHDRSPDDGDDPRAAAAVDWGASPWVGPRTAEDAPGGPRQGGRRRPATDPATDAAGGAEHAAEHGAVPGAEPGRRGRRRRGAPDDRPAAVLAPVDEAAAAPTPAQGRPSGVGRRPVSGRAPRALGADDDPVEVARQVCLDQLSYTARTRAELASALAHRGVPPEVAEQVLSRFGEVGLVDDEAFAAAWVARRSAGKGLARRALRQELRQRGIADTTAAQALEALDPEDEVVHARALVERRLASTAGLATDARLRRLVGMLARKGYPSGLAYRVVRDALGQEAEPLDEE